MGTPGRRVLSRAASEDKVLDSLLKENAFLTVNTSTWPVNVARDLEKDFAQEDFADLQIKYQEALNTVKQLQNEQLALTYHNDLLGAILESTEEQLAELSRENKQAYQDLELTRQEKKLLEVKVEKMQQELDLMVKESINKEEQAPEKHTNVKLVMQDASSQTDLQSAINDLKAEARETSQKTGEENEQFSLPRKAGLEDRIPQETTAGGILSAFFRKGPSSALEQSLGRSEKQQEESKKADNIPNPLQRVPLGNGSSVDLVLEEDEPALTSIEDQKQQVDDSVESPTSPEDEQEQEMGVSPVMARLFQRSLFKLSVFRGLLDVTRKPQEESLVNEDTNNPSPVNQETIDLQEKLPEDEPLQPESEVNSVPAPVCEISENETTDQLEEADPGIGDRAIGVNEQDDSPLKVIRLPTIGPAGLQGDLGQQAGKAGECRLS
ncbi:leucine-rich repeat flightless-interacting protein 2-like [Polypterus senegalus]|uniref:leucine-rich repeat flightless-interacting protein 2-like n=1 Tax=Polypterus senegalus TaxID=55291 RepID=UPI001966A3A7|nr:leucine-rich repeat flightless-interacting protein 2-like [Polypterus senegalus]